jgi:hypothetical protein
MNIVDIVVMCATIVANVGATIGDLMKADFVLKTSAEVGVDRSWIPLLAGLKAAGSAGLLLGLLGFRIIGTAAASGLALYFIGAILAHVRARVFYNIAFPGIYLALAAGSLACVL